MIPFPLAGPGRLCRTEAPFLYRATSSLDRTRRENVLLLADHLLGLREELSTAYKAGGRRLQETVIARTRELDSLYSPNSTEPVATIVRESGIRRIYFLEAIDGPNLEWARRRNRDRAQYTQVIFKTTTAPMVILLVGIGVDEKTALSIATPFAEACFTLQRCRSLREDFELGRFWFPETEFDPEQLDDTAIKAGRANETLAAYLQEKLLLAQQLVEKVRSVVVGESTASAIRQFLDRTANGWSVYTERALTDLRQGQLPTRWEPGFFTRL